MSGSNCCFLTYIQISQEAGKVVWYSQLLRNFPQFVMIYTVKGFGVINKAEEDVFQELSCFFMTQWMLAIWFFVVDKIANICWIIGKARDFQKNTFCFDYAKAFDCLDHNKLWKIIQEIGLPDHLTCLLRNLYVGQEATVRTGHGRADWFQIGKGICQGCILSPCLFNFHAEHIMWNARLDEPQLDQNCWEKYQ